MFVGILTFHSAHNYGAVLQAYATQETVKGLGCNIEIIDYRPDYLIKQRLFPRLGNQPISMKLKLLAGALLFFYWRYKRRNGFERFISSKLQLSFYKFKKETFSSNEIYDAYIVGSDQVWNIKFTKGFDSIFWGSFLTKKNALKFSYAASMSNYDISQNQRREMSDLLDNFDSVSVREDELKQLILQSCKIDVATVLDPTFLLDSSSWNRISKKPKIKKKYVLVYTIDYRDDVLIIAQSVAEQLSAIIIELTMSVDKNVIYNKHQTASPEEFLGLFGNSECVLTSSFHGTAFSVIFNKPFYSIAQGNDKDTRQITLLRKLGLLNRFISRDEIPDFQKINYKTVNSKLEVLRNESVDYLKRNLVGK